MDDPPHIAPDERASDDERGGREREARLAALRAAVQRGLDDADAGRVVDLDEGFDQVEAMLDEMEAARRA